MFVKGFQIFWIIENWFPDFLKKSGGTHGFSCASRRLESAARNFQIILSWTVGNTVFYLVFLLFWQTAGTCNYSFGKNWGTFGLVLIFSSIIEKSLIGFWDYLFMPLNLIIVKMIANYSIQLNKKALSSLAFLVILFHPEFGLLNFFCCIWWNDDLIIGLVMLVYLNFQCFHFFV